MQCQIIRPLLRAPCWCGSQLAVSRSFSYTLKTLEPTESKPTPRIFLSSPIGETNDAERRYIQAKTTTITPSEQSGKSDDFTVEHLEAKLKKVDLCKKYGLQPRDLGALEVDIIGRRAQIFVRPGTIVYSADIRAIIRRDKLLLFENKDKAEEAKAQSDEEESSQKPSEGEKKQGPDLADRLKAEMRRISLQGRQTFGEGRAEANPFEFIALEALLAQTTRTLFKGSDSLQERYTDLMDTLRTSEQIPTSALQKMLEIKDDVEEFKSTSEEFRQAIAELLREEADMAQMYLTDTENGKPHTVGDDDEIELLLEVYRHHAYTLTDLAATLLTRLQSITNHVTLLLSSTRNRLLNLEITLAFTTLSVSVPALIGAIFGMNLTSGLEETPHVFAGVSVAAVVLSLIIARWGRRALRRARSVKGEQEGLLRHSLPGWRGRLGRTPRQKVAE